MTKLVCISKKIGQTYFLHLTIDKIYEGKLIYNHYQIIDDNNENTLYPEKNFITLAEWRNKQINSILDDNNCG
jgi:hypothetical protein